MPVVTKNKVIEVLKAIGVNDVNEVPDVLLGVLESDVGLLLAQARKDLDERTKAEQTVITQRDEAREALREAREEIRHLRHEVEELELALSER